MALLFSCRAYLGIASTDRIEGISSSTLVAVPCVADSKHPAFRGGSQFSPCPAMVTIETILSCERIDGVRFL
jgi:hypothetical protein